MALQDIKLNPPSEEDPKCETKSDTKNGDNDSKRPLLFPWLSPHSSWLGSPATALYRDWAPSLSAAQYYYYYQYCCSQVYGRLRAMGGESFERTFNQQRIYRFILELILINQTLYVPVLLQCWVFVKHKKMIFEFENFFKDR